MKRAKILITGSNGIIGKVLKKALSDFDVYSVDIRGEQDEKSFIADISDYKTLETAFKKIGNIGCVIHLAADSRVEADWHSVLKNNIIGTRNVYQCARLNGVKKVIFASSNHVTGGYEGFPPSLHKQAAPRKISINEPIRPDSWYGVSKAFGEAVARQFFELYSISSICLRIGTVLEDDDPTKEERHLKTWLSHRDLIQLVRKSILSNIKFGIYYGVSKNKGRFWDISNAERELGYRPEDDASLFR